MQLNLWVLMLVMQMMEMLNLMSEVDAEETELTDAEVDQKKCQVQKPSKG